MYIFIANATISLPPAVTIRLHAFLTSSASPSVICLLYVSFAANLVQTKIGRNKIRMLDIILTVGRSCLSHRNKVSTLNRIHINFNFLILQSSCNPQFDGLAFEAQRS